MRYRAILPITFGLLAFCLVVADNHYQQIAYQNCSDCGGSVWPDQTPSILLRVINGPAASLSLPLPVILMPILLWWWWIGSRLDFGFLSGIQYRRPRRAASMTAVISACLLIFAAQDFTNGVRWLFSFDSERERTDLILVAVPFGIGLWWTFLALTGFRAARKIATNPPPDGGKPVLLPALCLITPLILSLRLFFGDAPELLRVYPAPKYDATISGTITDEAGNPVSYVEVQLFSAYSGGYTKWRKIAITNSNGSYSFSKLREGTYLVAVNGFQAPGAQNPYVTVFYPGTAREDEAKRIKAYTAKPVRLDRLQVKRGP